MLNNLTIFYLVISLIHSKSSRDVENNERCIINSITVMQMNAFPSIFNLKTRNIVNQKKKQISEVINLIKPTTPIISLGTFPVFNVECEDHRIF